MPDLSEQLSSILQNPQAQDSIRQLMGMLGQPAQNAQSPPFFFSGKPRRVLGWLCPACFIPFYIKKPSSAEGSGEQLSVHSPVKAVHSYDLGGSFKGRCLTGSILHPSGKGCPGLSLLSQHPLL